jgi:hypothetical protein
MKCQRLSVLLIGLFVLVSMAAPRPAAAQGYGPTPRIISVSSMGSGGGGRMEVIAAGQTQTSLDHSGPSLKVTAWFPADYTFGAGVLFNRNNTYAGPMQEDSSTLVRDGLRIVGWLLTFSVWADFTDGTCYAITERRTPRGTTYVGWHTLTIR